MLEYLQQKQNAEKIRRCRREESEDIKLELNSWRCWYRRYKHTKLQ